MSRTLQIGGREIREIMPELDVLFTVEAERIGRHFWKKSAFARELFLWAFEQYKKAGGSFRRLKSARLAFLDDETRAISCDELWDRIGARGQK